MPSLSEWNAGVLRNGQRIADRVMVNRYREQSGLPPLADDQTGELPPAPIINFDNGMGCRHRGNTLKFVPCELCVVNKKEKLVTISGCSAHGRCVSEAYCFGAQPKVCRNCEEYESKPVAPVAVVIPCHNYGRYLAECLQSVLDNSVIPQEIVVVADRCTDDTLAVAERFAAQNVQVISVEHGSPHLSRLTGINATTAEYICCLDADDRISTGYLETGCLTLQGFVQCGVVYTDLHCFGESSEVRVLNPLAIEHSNYIHAGGVFRRAAYESSGCGSLFAYRGVLEDWLVWRKMLANGWQAVKSASRYHYRIHGQSLLHTAKPDWSYYDRAGLAHERLTIAIPLSGRWEWWAQLAMWLERQTWANVSLLLVETSGDAEFQAVLRQYAARSRYRDVRVISLDVEQPGLADEDRTQLPVYRSVQQTMPTIYNRIRTAVDTEYVLIVEDDILPPGDAAERLMRSMDAGVATVSGLYVSRYVPAYLAWDETGDMTTTGTGVQVVSGTGFGCLLIRGSVLKSAVFHAGPPTGNFDKSFFETVGRMGLQFKLDWSVQCRHQNLNAEIL